jgi:hypothetical protein
LARWLDGSIGVVCGLPYGYVPLWDDDPAYIKEKQREIKEGMAACGCSNCLRAKAHSLIKNLVFANKDNFDDIAGDRFTTSKLRDISKKYPPKPLVLRKRKIPACDRDRVDAFKTQLIEELHEHYTLHFGTCGPIGAADIFGDEEAEGIIAHMHHINSARDLRGVIGGECFDGQLEWLFTRLSTFKSEPTSGDLTQSTRHKFAKSSSNHVQVPLIKRSASIATRVLSTAGPRPPTKRAIAAEAARRRLLEKKAQNQLWLESELRRKEQVAQFLREGLERAEMGRVEKHVGNSQLDG